MFHPTERGSNSPAGGGRPDPVALKVSGGSGSLTVLVNGLPQPAPPAATLFFEPEGPGFVRSP
jgi:penicillin-binding protein 1C